VHLCGAALFAQNTDISIGTTTLQPSVKRLGINLGTLDYYDSGQTTQNLLMNNPGFEGQIWNSTIRCATGTATSCTDDDQWSAWPAGFWNGATFEVFYGAAAGRTGTVTYSTAPGNGQGLTLNFANAGVAPATGDYVIVRKTVPGGASGGWWPSSYGNGVVGDNLTDLPPATLGKQTVVLTAPTSSDAASISGFFDSVTGKTFLQLNGTYQLQFKAKGIGGSNQVQVMVSRSGVGTYYNQPIALTGSWKTYTVNFSAAENGSAIGIAGVNFSTVGADAFELDDVTLVKTNGDPTNTTAFRDPVVNALRTLQPGVLRYWGGQLGDTLDNLLTPQFGRQRAGYSAWWTESDAVDYGLHDFLVLCQTIGAEPWFVVPSTFSTTDASNLIEYLGGNSTSTVYGAKRAALGQTTPWTQVFSKIHLEFGNEAWNGTFKGASIEYSEPYGGRAQTIFGAMQANPSFAANAIDMVLGGQSAYVGRNSDIQNNCNNNTSFAIAPYTMSQVDSYTDNESLYGSTFAEPEAYMSSSGSAEGLTPGMVYQNYQAIQGSNHPVPLSFYEINLSTMNGAISQEALNSYTPSLGAGLMVADTMLLSMRQFGVVNQELFALPQYNFIRPDGKSVLLWGSVVDMGVTDRKRPQFLALQLANQALSNGAAMLQTTHTGADPTWNQPSVNSVQLNGAHFLHSFAFSNNGTGSVVVFNLSRSSALPVTFSGPNAPSGTVQMQQLTSANPSDTNETANVVNIVPSTLTNFAGSSGLSLPPYSMTVLTWNTTSNPAPVISAVSSSNITGTSATITWTTDQPSSSLVNYGASTAYGSASPLNSTLATAHSVTLTGLTAGTTYNYQVASANSAGTTATSGNYTFATASAAPVVSGVTATAISANSATIVWNTDQASSSLVQYGTTTAYGSTSAQNSSLTASHSVTITGLTAGTLYDFAVVSANAAGKSTTSGNFTFTTLTVPPVISAVSATNIGTTSATIVWTTDQPSSSQVQFGTTASYGSSSALNSSLVTTHSVTLSGLTPGATYNYDVVSANFAGNSATSANFSFSTTSAAPAISAVAAGSITASSATITWTTNQATNAQVLYGTTAAYGSSTSINYTLTTAHSVTLTGLTAGATYNYAVVSQNATGNTSTSSNFSFTTSQAASPAPGPQVGYVAFWGITGSSVTISWSTNTLATTAVSYGTTSALGQVSPVQTALTANHGVTLTGLTGGTTYYFVAQSTDANGNTGYSTMYSFTTANTNPPVISGITVTPGSGNKATISWTTNIRAVSWITFGPTTAYGHWSQFTSPTTNPQPSMGWVPGGVVHYQLHSVDASGHEEDSPDYTFVEP
jgi:hypothetical protein